MGLPLILAMTPAEMACAGTLPEKCAWMACQFSPWGQGISNIPEKLPPNSVLILNDRTPCQGHSPDLVAGQIEDILSQFGCKSLLLDFQRPGSPEAEAVIRGLCRRIPCPVIVSECYAANRDNPVFLPPAPLHVPLEKYLAPWQEREIWLEAGLCQETITVTEKGTAFAPQFPTDGLEDGFYDDALCCRYRTYIRDEEIRFTLFDTRESLRMKLELAQSLGVASAVGLYLELG